ncbi:hypothetical protein HNR06_004642 [Nocardiopsis arvandica]|uniref:Uncharacterized protein n=1 Tax=Nocardiopsis sinuspersici TaxID=501010 RepID=A0A7Z0BKP2_9ACTN|nr:hypothetical protein [Nocardiopsis sinuspersici]
MCKAEHGKPGVSARIPPRTEDRGILRENG